MTADALIVGAGIVGAACAAELAALGMRVEVLDAQGIGGGATAAGMGHIVVMNDSPAEFALSRYSRDLWLELAPRLRPRDAFARCGTLWVAADEEEWQAARAMQAAFVAEGMKAQLLDASVDGGRFAHRTRQHRVCADRRRVAAHAIAGRREYSRATA
jgi:D-hydroxyproline dehydrogenase subunit beta